MSDCILNWIHKEFPEIGNISKKEFNTKIKYSNSMHKSIFK